MVRVKKGNQKVKINKSKWAQGLEGLRRKVSPTSVLGALCEQEGGKQMGESLYPLGWRPQKLSVGEENPRFRLPQIQGL